MMLDFHTLTDEMPCWIGPPNWQDQVKPDIEHPYALRQCYTLDLPVTQAKMHIAAAWRYCLFVNGTFIHQGPARSFPEHAIYDELDITEHLHVGENILAVLLLSSPGVPGYTPVTRSGFWLSSKVQCHDQVYHWRSDTTWQIQRATWINSHGLLISLPVGQQEHYVAALEPQAWKTRMDDDAMWKSPYLLGTHPTPPWWELTPRPIPLLIEQALSPRVVWQGRLDGKIPDYPVNPAIALNEAQLDGDVCDEPFETSITLEPCQVITFDFGQTMAVRPGLELLDGCGEGRLLLAYDIGLGERPMAMLGFKTVREGFVDSVTSTNAPATWQAMLPRGMRVMTLINDSDHAVTFSMRCRQVLYPFAKAKEPDFKEDGLKRIWENSIRTLEASCCDAVVDTCSRENMLWTLDACLGGEAAWVTFGDHALWRRCLQLIAQGIDDHGCPRAVVPAELSFMTLFDQTMFWVVSCQRYVQHTGDQSLLDEVAPAIDRFLQRCAKHVTDEGLFVPPNYSWHFVDWIPLPRLAYSMPINGLLLWACDAADRLKACSVAAPLGAQIRRQLQRFYDDEAGCYRNHIQPQCDVGIQSTFNHTAQTVAHSLHANALALRTGLPDAQQEKSVVRFMLDTLLKPDDLAAQMGPGWVDTILGPLVERGYQQQVQTFLKATFGKQLDAGMPTWSEGMGLGNPAVIAPNTAHAWGAAVNVLLEKLL